MSTIRNENGKKAREERKRHEDFCLPVLRCWP